MSFLTRLFGRRAAAPDGETAPARETARDSDAAPVEPLLINAYATVRDPPPLAFPHALRGRRDRADPELAPHLDGFIGYVLGRGDSQMTAARYHLWRHLQRVRNHVSLEVVTADLAAVEAWAQAANAVLFLPDGSVRAPDLAILISAAGESDPVAALPYPSDALARRARTLVRLEGMNPKPPSGMPPALGEEEVVLRAPAEVLRRALALFYVAACGQARGTGVGPIPAGQLLQNPLGFDALTPRERAQAEAATAEEAVAMSWRYEAANTLFWALGREAAEIGDSDRLIDVDELWRDVADLARSAHAGTPLRLRTAGEILDALDRAWREHWIVRQSRQKNLLLDGLNGDVVAERHVALNWLTGFQNDFGTAWDEIDTPT